MPPAIAPTDTADNSSWNSCSRATSEPTNDNASDGRGRTPVSFLARDNR